MKYTILVLVGALVAISPANARVIARCGASDGQAYYVAPQEGWHDDRISSGDLIFTFSDDEANVLFRDATGATIDAREDGASVLVTRVDTEAREFGLVVMYAATGVVETYNIISTEDGRRRVIWTSNKPHIGPGGMLSKVGAYVAECD